MKYLTCKFRTLCEVLREINDMHQSDSEHDKIVRKKLSEAEDMGKRMDKKLLQYNKDVYKDFWEANKDYEEDLQRRLDTKYIIE